MRLLFDENTSYRIIKKLQKEFPEAIHVSSVNLLATKDMDIFEYAKQNGFHIVTFDEDYYTIRHTAWCASQSNLDPSGQPSNFRIGESSYF